MNVSNLLFMVSLFLPESWKSTAYFMIKLFVTSIVLSLIPLMYYGLTIYKIEDSNTITTIRKHIKLAFIRNENYEPSAFFIGWYYIGFIHQKIGKESVDLHMYCICTTSQFKQLEKKNDIVVKVDDKIVELIELSGDTRWNRKYVKQSIPFNTLANTQQQEIIDQIINFYNSNNVCVVMITGVAGTGKSTIAWIVARQLKGILCEDYNPTKAGCNILKLRKSAEPSKEKPLIILYNEFDVNLEQVHQNKIVEHKFLTTEIYDKSTWNTFFDRIEKKTRPNSILILTSNKTKEQIEKECDGDNSYLRHGRVNLYFDMKEAI